VTATAADTATVTTVDQIMSQWRAWAAQAAVFAGTLERHGERFDGSLKRARGNVRKQAALLLRETPDRHAAADLMVRNAIRHSVLHAPMIGYDEAAVSYTKARTWQACALELNPDLPEVQPLWD
jgi:hypothetical protein